VPEEEGTTIPRNVLHQRFQTFFKWGPLSLVRMFYGPLSLVRMFYEPPYSWDYQTH